MKKKMMGCIVCILAASVLLTGNSIMAKPVKKTIVKTKKITMQTGQKRTIKLKNKKKNAKYIYKSSKAKIAKVSKKGVVTALKSGNVKISVKEKFKGRTKGIGSVTVHVKRNKILSPVQSPLGDLPTQSAPAITTCPLVTPTPLPIQGEAEEPQQTATPKPPVNPEIKDTPLTLNSYQSGVSYGTKIEEQYYSSTTKKDRNVIVVLPNGYTEEKKYPVLYLFHGGMGDETDWIQGNIVSMIGNMIADGEAEEMIIVLPNCRCREDDSAANADGFALGHVQSFDNFINDFRDNLMPYMEENYSIATGRDNTAIAGLSMGGRVALHIGFSLPDKVGYTGAFSPAYGIFPYTNNGLTETGLFNEETFTLPDEYKNSTFVLLNTGNQDTMVSGEPARYHDTLTANGVHHTFYTLDGNHDWTVWRNGFYNYARYLFK